MKKEKYIKAKRTELKKILKYLEAARDKVGLARILAEKTAACCESSLDCLETDIENNIAYTVSHLQVGILEGDLIGGKKNEN